MKLVFVCIAIQCILSICALASNRIMGGVEVDIKKFGWQLSLQYESEHKCGASIISKDWAITAAHCVEDLFQIPQLLSLRAGSDQHDSGGVVYGISEVWIHPGYGLSMNYDVALLKVSETFDFTVCTIRPITLAAKNDQPETGAPVTVTGWGHSKENGSMEKYLHGVELNIVDHDTCDEIYTEFGGITENMICAGVNEGEKDSCKGDSGGPLIDKNRKLVGIVSWGFVCGRSNNPGVYTNIASTSIRDYIFNMTGI